MNRLLKFIATLLIVVILLGVIAAVLLPRFIDPNDYRDDIAQLVHDKSGFTLNIDGPIGWSIFPWVGLSLDDVTVKGVDDSTLAHLGEAEISIKLLPLLSKQVEMQTVRVNDLDLSLVKDKSGKGNWEVEKPIQNNKPTASESKQQEPIDEPADISSDKKESLPIQLNVASVQVANLLISYDDQQSNTKYLINQASLTTSSIRNQEPIDFKLQSRITVPDAIFRASVSGLLKLNIQDGIYSVSQLNISANPDVDKAEVVNIVGHIDAQQTPLNLTGELNVTKFNLRNLMKQLKIKLPPMASKTAMSSLSFDSQFMTDGKSFNANKLALQLDDFAIDGQFQILDLKKQNMKFSFNGNDLNLDNYLPPATASTTDASAQNKTGAHTPTTTTAATVTTTKEQPLIPEDLLRPLDIDGSMKLTSLTVAKRRFEKPFISLKAANGKQDVTIGSGFYQGKIDLNTKLDVSQKGTPKLNVSAHMKGISLEAMAQPIPALEPVQGLINADFNVNTQGQLQSVLTKNLNGKIQFSIDKGVFTNANFDKLVCEGIASIRKTDLDKTDWGDSTHFKDLSGTFIIKDGVASNNNLIASLSNLNLKGDGKIDLVKQHLDYHMGLNIRGAESPDSDPACQVNEDYVNVIWPVRCEGTIGSQKCGIDSQRLTDTVTGLFINEGEKRLKDEIQKNIEGPVKDLLKGLFK
ncbi:hypothetical protein ACH42_07980 [Endozoicomonas sp. (ex Bugula neritina AB1)]|nr:hypothetical protein ACH42_07980 [Endozoicomonas sp. (ex Bugula neritina AB1)]